MKILSLLIFSSSLVFAKTPRAQLEASPHVHGAAKCSIAFDGMDGRIEFKTSSDSISGFEHSAVTEADKNREKEALAKLESAMPKMIVFQPNLRCVLTKEKIEVQMNGKHSDTLAEFKVICERSPEGSKITFQFQKYFPNLKDVDVTVLSGSVQTAIEAKQAGSFLELK